MSNVCLVGKSYPQLIHICGKPVYNIVDKLDPIERLFYRTYVLITRAGAAGVQVIDTPAGN